MVNTAPYTNEMVHDAKMIALYAHRGHMYGEILPFERHLTDVTDILKEHNCGNKLEIVGWLHDTIEDTNITYAKIRDVFGVDVAELVYSVTDELGRNRKERREKTYPKIIAIGEEAILVKLADRLANMTNAYKYNLSMQEMYLKEFESFYVLLHNPEHEQAKPLWDKLIAMNDLINKRLHS